MTKHNMTDFSVAAILAKQELQANVVNRQLEGTVYSCSNCNMTCTSTLYLERHQKSCYTKGGFSVSVETNNLPTDLTSLRQVCDGRKLYCCPYCTYQTSLKCNIVRHLNIHTGVRPFKCKVCVKGFTTKNYLTIHQRTHTGEKPYKCSQCDYSSSEKVSLKRHINSKHSGEVFYACSDCEYKTALRSSMQAHTRKHTGERPYHCPYCQYRATQKSSLTFHIFRKHTYQQCTIQQELVTLD